MLEPPDLGRGEHGECVSGYSGRQKRTGEQHPRGGIVRGHHRLSKSGMA